MRLPVLLVASLTACGVHPEPTTWVPLDTSRLLFELANPTATVADLEDGLEELDEEMAYVLAGNAVVLDVAGPHLATEAVDDPYVDPDETGEVHATNVFVRIACPGEDAEAGPDPEFDFGHVQIESPLLFEDNLSVLQGDLLLHAVECVIGESTTDATLRGMWDPEAQRLLAKGDIHVEVPEVAEAALQRVSRLDIDEGASRFSVDLGDESVYATASASGVEGEFHLLLADGEATCTLEPEPACTMTTR